MNVDERMGSCREKGRMWGRVGARVGPWWKRARVGTAWSTKVAPHPGQAQGPLIHTTPPLVPTGPWDASISMDRITRFGRQHSSGLDLAGGEELSSAFEPCLRVIKTISGDHNADLRDKDTMQKPLDSMRLIHWANRATMPPELPISDLAPDPGVLGPHSLSWRMHDEQWLITAGPPAFFSHASQSKA